MSTFKTNVYVLCLIFIPLLFFGHRAYLASTTGLANKYSVVWTTICFILYVKVVRTIAGPFYFGPFRHLPQPAKDHFALGNGLDLIAGPPFTPIFEIIKHTPNHGLVLIRSFLQYSEVLVPTTPAALSEVLHFKAYDYIKPSQARDFLRRIIGDGLVIAEGQQHKLHRRAVTPAFHGSHINNLVPLFWHKAREFVETLAKEMHVDASDEQAGGIIEISAIASRVTLDIIGVASLGKDFNTLEEPDNDLVRDFFTIMDPSDTRIGLHAFVTLNFSETLARYFFPKTEALIESTTARLRDTCTQLVEDKRAAMLDDPVGHVDILSILLKNGSLTDDELIDELLTFLAAGHETTASALTWAVYELSRHPEVQEKLRAEIRSNSDISDERAVDADTLEAMPYLNAVCMETLRFWATVPMTSRVAVCDTSIAGTLVPSGAAVLIIPCIINKLPALWGDDAEQFVPERWIRDDGNVHGGSHSPYSMLTFIHGPRSCIGQGFAKSELKCLLAAMVNKFDITLADPRKEVVPAGFITMKPKDGLVLRLRPL